jgi:pimeloyl-ACP methyl ester carboxylesterase
MYIYLHGFASGSGSTKAQEFKVRCASVGVDLLVPDLNQGDFTQLTISRQIAQVVDLFPQDRTPVTLIGASLGGWTAAIIAQDYPQVERLILLAPAFNFLDLWLPKLGTDRLKSWKDIGYLNIYHYAVQNLLPLHYNFIADARKYHLFPSDRILSTLIIHGIYDDVIPIDSSRDFVAKHPWVELVEVESDHALIDCLELIWQKTVPFFTNLKI